MSVDRVPFVAPPPMPDPLWIWFGWYARADGYVVWRCYQCERDWAPYGTAAVEHAQAHLRMDLARVAQTSEPGTVGAELQRRAQARLARFDACLLAEQQRATAADIAAITARRRADELESQRRYEEYKAEREQLRAARRVETAAMQARRRAQHAATLQSGMDQAERYALMEDSGFDALVGPLLDVGEREQVRELRKRVVGPEWVGLHRRRCVCRSCAARYPDRLADGLLGRLGRVHR